MTEIEIKTERLLLRATRHEDLDAIAAIWGDSEGGKYLSDPFYKSGEEIKEILDFTPECPVYYFAAIPHGLDEVITTCSLGPENIDSDVWAIGYTVRKDCWGNGYAGEMINAMINFAKNKGLHAIIAPVAKENIASNKVLQKCGFRIYRESSFKKSGTDITYPSYVYKMLLAN